MISHENYFYDQPDCGKNYITVRGFDQKGTGVGGFLKGVFRKVLPILKKGGKVLGKEALATGITILDDVTMNKIPLKESIRKRVCESGKNLKRKAEETLDKIISGSGYKMQRQAFTHHSSSDSGLARIPKQKNKNKKKKKQRKLKKKAKKNKGLKKNNKKALKHITQRLKKINIRSARDIFEE